MDVTLLSAHEQARLIASRELSARELLAAVEHRYEQLNPMINAVVVERLDAARELAAAADQAVVDGGELGIFHGVPITVKEVIDWVGTPSTWGDPRHVNHLPRRNAVVLDRLLDQGAVVWGKTNVPLNLGDWQTFNAVYGRTNNPHALDRTPGGSSGGSAAALAVGFAGLEIGSDIGGSIRFPAHYCGVFGHKPSYATVSASGHDYPGHDGDADINVVGPMARTAIDLERAMRLLSDRVLVEEHRVALSEFTVGVMFENPIEGEQDVAMTSRLRSAVSELRALGLQVSEVPTGIDHRRAQQNYLYLNYAATTLRAENLNEAGAAPIDFSHRVWLELSDERHRIRDQWAHYFSKVDLLLCPAAAGVAPFHQTDVPFPEQTILVNGREISNQDQWVWAGMASGAYLPATVAPVAQTDDGLPIGMQIIAPFAHDLRGITFARLVEQTLGDFRPPPVLDS